MADRKSGFTIIELMVTVALVVIVLALGTPSFRTLVADNRMAVQANTLLGALHLARSEAVKRGGRVTVCKSSDGAVCAGSGGWEQGWIAFVDANADGDRDAGEEILRVNEALEGSGQSLIGTADVASYISFTVTGAPRMASGASQSGTLVLCDDRGFGATSKAVVLAQSGRVSVIKASEDAMLTDCSAS